MKSTSFSTWLLLLCGGAVTGLSAEIQLDGHTFTLPEGFAIQRVAGPPLVDRPIVADYDEQGRLYVADSSGSNDPVQNQLKTKPHRIVRLEDTDGDGRFDQSVVWAGQMMFPEGAMWLNGSLYVSAPPSIWKLTDTNNDGRADQREEWFQGRTLTGCANDLHGPYRGLDGWIYWCKGAFAQQEHPQADGSSFVTRAAHIFRRHPRGGPVEPVMTGGMDNPIDVVFTPEGERIFTTTFFQHPGGGKRDGLIHAVYGGVYGKQHNVIQGHPRTGPLMPVLTHLGPAAPCGLVLYEADAFGPGFRNNLFACNFNLHKLTRHILHPDGATFKTTDSDFLVSDQVDFHPTDVLEDRDGSLLVIDTGGWYKICCPTSQLYKPDVLGAIYRVTRIGAPVPPLPLLPSGRETQADLAAWARLLSSPTPFIARRAMQTLAAAGTPAVATLKPLLVSPPGAQGHPLQIQRAVWTLTRIDHASARAAVRLALRHSENAVRHAAAHSAGLWRDPDAVSALVDCLNSGASAVQRAAAEALGRIRDVSAVPALLQTAAQDSREDATPDSERVLDHSLIYALIQLNHPPSTVPGLSSPHQRTRRVALVALDQMKDGRLSAGQVAPWLASANPELRDTARWIVNRHPEWAPELADFFQTQLVRNDLSSHERQTLPSLLGRFASDPRVQNMLAESVRDAQRPEAIRRLAFQGMTRADLDTLPRAWADALTEVLKTDAPAWQATAAAAARDLPSPNMSAPALTAALTDLANHKDTPADIRLDALMALRPPPSPPKDGTFEFLLQQLPPDSPAFHRRRAGTILARTELSGPQEMKLAENLVQVSPLELGTLLGAFRQAKTEALGLKIMESLRNSPSRFSLRHEILLPALEGFPSKVQTEGRQLLASLHTDAAEQKARLDQLFSEMKSGDVRRGQAVFNSSRAACATCHAIGYLGGNYGPDLTRIGQIRTERDLLEAIVYPSASFVRSYEPIIVTTHDDEEFSGILRQDSPREVVVAIGPDQDIRLDRARILDMRPGTMSVMPGGLEEQLSRQELADLVAFLRATRW